jgi:hypothetical protein
MDEPTRAPQHDAPPPWRPLSAGAVTALVLALLLAPVALLGPWWVEILPLVVGAGSWWAIADGRRRGRGIAIVACVIALVAGTASLLYLGQARDLIVVQFDGFLRALSRDDRAEVATWVIAGEDAPAAVARWRERLQAVEREAGPYGQRVEVDWGLWGPMVGLLAAPDGDLVEIGAPEGGPRPALGTLWVRAGFARERCWAAFELGRKGEPLGMDDVRGATPGKPLPFVRDVRFFRTRPVP